MSFYFLKQFLDGYLPVQETRQYALHFLIYAVTLFAGISTIMSTSTALLTH